MDPLTAITMATIQGDEATSRVEAPMNPTSTGRGDGIETPVLLSPPESKTPPTATHKRNQTTFEAPHQDRNSEPVDPSALSKALEQFEQAGRVRERTPTASPSRKRARIYGDR